jgi:hypothetical protein
MGITRRALGVVAEKNLLKLVLTNKHTSLQVVNNRSGDTFLQARHGASGGARAQARRRAASHSPRPGVLARSACGADARARRMSQSELSTSPTPASRDPLGPPSLLF